MDSPLEVQPHTSSSDQVHSEAVLGAENVNEPYVVSDSGSSTEIEEEEEEGDDEQNQTRPRLPATWAFSQRAAGRPTNLLMRRRIRQGLRVHYPSQTGAPSRGFPDFLLRAPAANAVDPESGSTSEISESEEEDAAQQGAPAPEAEQPAPPASPRLSGTVPLSEAQEPNTSSAPNSQRTEAASQGAQAAQVASAAPACVLSPPTEEGEGDTCTICFEAWTTAGDHRPSALRCGHLFGFTCIQRWIKSAGAAAKCPQCNKKTKRSDIVKLYVTKLRALDNTEQETLKRALEHEQSLRRKAELESAQDKLRLQVVTNQCGQIQKELQELRALMTQTGGCSVPSAASSSSASSSLLSGLSQRPDGSRSGQYSFSKAVLMSQSGGCRVLAYCEPLSCLLASQPSPHATLVPGCGVKKMSVVNMKASQYVPIHSKQIRGLSFNTQNDSLLLSSSLDNTIKLTSLLTNTVVQTYNAGRPVWSCCWCLDNSNYVYAGLINGSVLIYDTRDTSTHVQELQPLRSRCPVASLCYVPRAASSSFPCGGLIAGSLEGACFWEQVNEATYRPHVLPLETSGCTDIQVEPESRHCLVTYRPGRSNPTLRCVLMALNRTPQGESSEAPVCSCSPVQSFSAGTSCKLLTKTPSSRVQRDRELWCARETSPPTQPWCGTLAAAFCSRSSRPTSRCWTSVLSP